MKKLIIGTSLALATLVAMPSFAATHHSRAQAEQAYSANASDEATFAAENGVTAKGPAIYVGGVYAGWDPDPNIRLMLTKDPILQ